MQASWKYVYLKAAILTGSLAVHQLVTGLAIGISQNIADLAGVAIACFAHEWTHSSALIVLYISLGLTKKAMRAMIIPFILCTPTSIFVGTSLMSSLQGRPAAITEGILLAVASGAFIFVAVCELVSEVFDKDVGIADKLICFGLMAFFASAISVIPTIEGIQQPPCTQA